LFITPAIKAQLKISYDGYYIYTQPDKINPFKYYLRFYPEGTVIAVTTAGKAENLVRWFTKDYKEVTKGKYDLKDSVLHFALKTENGEVNYEGIITYDNRLKLNVSSLINNYEGKEEYYFLKMEGVK
jgi:hypothetical protein